MPDEEVTVNVDTAAPPVAPAVKATEVVLYAVAVAAPIVGACGTDNGVVDADADDAVEVPLAFVAVTVYVRAVPTVSEIDIGVVAPEAVAPDDEVTVKLVMADPPVALVVNGTDTVADPVYACPDATVGVPIVGFCGTVVAVMLFDAEEATPVPPVIVAT